MEPFARRQPPNVDPTHHPAERRRGRKARLPEGRNIAVTGTGNESSSSYGIGPYTASSPAAGGDSPSAPGLFGPVGNASATKAYEFGKHEAFAGGRSRLSANRVSSSFARAHRNSA